MSETAELSESDQAFLQPFLPPSARPGAQAAADSPPHERPFVTLTYAASLDSRIALSRGVRTTLSGPETKSMTHFLRLHHDAVLVGFNTAIIDDPALNCRYPGATLEEQPRPVIIDPKYLWNPEGKKVMQLAAEGAGKGPLILTRFMFTPLEPLSDVGGARLFLDRDDFAREDPARSWDAILKALKREGIDSVMIEGGAYVINSLLAQPDLVDAVIITIAPTFLGQDGVAVAPPSKIENGRYMNAGWLCGTSWRQFGNDAVLCGRLLP